MSGRRTTTEYMPDVTDGYLDYLREVKKKRGLNWSALKGHPELDPATISRVVGEEGDRTEKPSPVTVERVRRAMEELSGEEVAPPFLSVEDEEHWEWIRAGVLLKKHKPALYQELFDAAHGVVGPILALEKRERRARITLDKLKKK